MTNEARRSAPPRLTPLTFKHNPDLPISARREEIVAALERHQVLIVAGDTGSGKSTQLPQYCLELGRGVAGRIAHTQPRRLAARALATRIAEEVGQPLGQAVGFRVRFADQVSDATRLVLLTDGLLLAELASDPMLRRYDTLIVDEAHERTLNIDLLLGVLKRLLPRRPDLKLIVTSATLDVERVARFFDDAPVIAVSGRGYPIETRYLDEPQAAEDPDLPVAVLSAYQAIAGESMLRQGDVLVFLPGEREIRDVGEFLERELRGEAEVLPLYSRLSWEQQARIFNRGPRRRIILATNIAETSVTVPGIRAVIDSGLARISRYSPRNRLQRLPIEPVSRASADQRKGRCGRIGPGICVRLYAEADFDGRPAFTEPEVLRTNLAALLLRLAADGLGDAETFPFIDAPDSRAIGDGYRLLQELEAFDAERRITRRGRAMARLPLDPRLARALLESVRFQAESELLAIVAGLSVPDVRLGTGVDNDESADAVIEDGRSEFVSLVKLWRAYRGAREGSRREVRRWCKERGLSVLRLSEWEDVHTQVVERARELGIVARGRPASYAGVHRALLTGFCAMVGSRGEDGAYSGTRGVKFQIFPGSPLRRRKPKWVMAANIVETSRVFARRVAEIEPAWVESAGRHMLKREYLEPDWDEVREEVTARERVGFLGLILSAHRKVNYGPIAPEESRLIFAREALVHRRLGRRPGWLQANDAAIAAAQRMEERLRSRDLVAAPEAFIAFYEQRLPRQVSSAATLENFTRHLPAEALRSLELSPADIFVRPPDEATLERFPERAQVGSLAASVTYVFAPGEAGDGATLEVPLLALPTLTRAVVDASVPGLAAPRIEALLRSLPKEARRPLIPMNATVQAFQEQVGAGRSDEAHLRRWLIEHRGIHESLARFDTRALAAHLTVQVAVNGPGGEIVARGASLADLRRRCAGRARAALERHARFEESAVWQSFDRARLEERRGIDSGAGVIDVFPTLMTHDDTLRVSYEWSAEEAACVWRDSAPRLARKILERQSKDLAKRIAEDGRLVLAASPTLDGAALVDVLLQWTFRGACFGEKAAPRERDAFLAALEQGRPSLYDTLDLMRATLLDALTAGRGVRALLDDPRARGAAEAARESRDHIGRLLGPVGLASRSADGLRQLPRHLKAEQKRWQRVLARGSEAPSVLAEIDRWNGVLHELRRRVQAEHRTLDELDELAFWIEEYRVSLYAQELKTFGAVSAARLEARAARIEAWLER